MKKIVLAGGSGFLGQSIIRYFNEADTEFVILSRTPEDTGNPNVRMVYWHTGEVGAWQQELDGAFAVINLAGRSVNCRYTEKNRTEILNSRVDATNAIGIAINRCSVPPKVWINAGSLAIYGSTGPVPITEESPVATGFSADVCRQWEEAFNDIIAPLTRKVILRIGLVLGKYGGPAAYYKHIACWGAGGRQGNGQQYISWIHEEDLVSCIKFVLNNETTEGTFNCTSPGPVTNAELNATVRQVLGVSFGLRLGKWIISAGACLIGTAPELVLNGRRALPARLMQQGFTFKYGNLQQALQAVYNNTEADPVRRSLLWWWVAVTVFILAGPALAFRGQYGYALFITIPVCLGFSFTMLQSAAGKKNLKQLALRTSLLGLAVCSLFIFAGIEGLICIVMAIPIVLPLMLTGALLAYVIQKRLWARVYMPMAVLLLNPLSLLYDVTNSDYKGNTVTTQVLVNAADTTVWKQLTGPFNFGESAFFWLRRGISYPLAMKILEDSSRQFLQCTYSNGSMQAPVDSFTKNRLLRFHLTQPPVAMRETSVYPHIQPQHVSTKFFVEYGEFRINPVNDTSCMLTARTRYRYKIGPEAYWALWSDFLLDKMHHHVLQKIKIQSELSQHASAH